MDKEFLEDRLILQDILLTEEYFSHVYQFSMRDFRGQLLRDDWADFMSEELSMAFEVMDDLQKRGWLDTPQPVSRADQKRLQAECEENISNL